MKKSWKLILIALLAALLVCTCMSALAENLPRGADKDPNKCTHPGIESHEITDKDEYVTYTATSDGHLVNEHHEYQCEYCGFVKKTDSQVPVKHENTAEYRDPDNDVKQTCTDAPYDAYKCKKCGQTWKAKTGNALGHDIDAAKEVGAVEWVQGSATCLKKPIYEFDCPRCLKHVRVEGDEVIYHDFTGDGYHDIVEPATCSKPGRKYDKCKVCNQELNIRVLPQLDHVANFLDCVGQNYTTQKDATCTENGELVGTCKWCAQVIYKTTAKTGHTLVTKTVKAATCTEPGLERAECSNPLCSYAEPEYAIPPKGHNYDDAIEHVPNEASGLPNCTKPGTSTWYLECPRCHAVLDGVNTPIPALGHQYEPDKGSYSEQVEVASCTHYGLLRIWCARCDDRDAHIDVQIPMVAHVHSDAPDAWTTSDTVGGYDATCMNTGLAVNLCVNCHGDPQTKVVPKKSHDFPTAKEVNDNKVEAAFIKTKNAAKCESAGSATVYCRLGCKTTSDLVLPALGHDWNEAAAVYEPANKIPTCTQAVTKTHTCWRCSKSEIVVVTPALGHLYSGTNPSDTAPTCTEPGIRWGVCQREGCQERDHDTHQVIPALGHKAGTPTVTAATCTVEGKTETKCTVCGAVIKSEAIPKTAHTPVDKVVTEATTSKEGLIETRCSVCNTLLGTKAIPKKASSSSGSGSGSSSSGSGTGSTVVSNVVTGTINSAGVSAAELGATSTAMVTPIDLSVDGTYTYSLVANGQYVVGTVTFVVSNGTFSASYTVNPGVVVSAPSLVVFANVDALKAGTATTVGFNAIFDGAGDTKVIAAVTMVGTFSTTSATPYVADAAQVAAMKAIVD